MSYFDTVTRSYADVNVDGQGVHTDHFIEATEGLVKLFDLLGSAAFKVVQSDLSGNIEKLRARMLANPTQSMTIEELVKKECAEAGSDKKKKKATEGLMWLLRGLDFTSKALRRNISNVTEELSSSFTEAYGVTLRQYHSMVVRPLFSLAMKACPYRVDFYTKLQGTGDKNKTATDMEQWLGALEKIVGRLQTFLKQGGYTKQFE